MLRRRSAQFRSGLALAATALLLLAGCAGPPGSAEDPVDDPATDSAVDVATERADGDLEADGSLDEAADDVADDAVDDADEDALDGDGDGVGDGDSDPDAADADEPGQAIRDIDLGALEWREAVSEQYVTPAEEPGPIQYAVAEPLAYADVDGDGHEDALAGLEITDGQGFEQIWYIWTWDEQAQTAVQVESPIARMARCGDAVLEVAAADGSFAVTEALRPQGDTSDCASLGHIQFTRHVTLEDGWPVLTGGVEGDGGICPQPDATDALFPVEYPLHTGPLETMSTLSDPAPVGFAEVDVSGHLWLFREHWMLIHVTTEESVDQRGGYVPCAWVHLEEDTRPIPHAPHLPEA